MKASELIRDAYQELGVLGAEQPLSGDMTATGIRYINRMMQSYDYLNLGYAIINSASDAITIPGYAEDWAVKELALQLAQQNGEYEGLAGIRVNASLALENLMKNRPLDISMINPVGMPVGSGNSEFNGKFYPPSDDMELTEIGGYTLLE